MTMPVNVLEVGLCKISLVVLFIRTLVLSFYVFVIANMSNRLFIKASKELVEVDLFLLLLMYETRVASYKKNNINTY